MSDPQSIWTLDSLARHIDQLLSERDVKYNERFSSQEKAVQTAQAANEKRLDNVNEFRGQLKDQATEFIRKVEADARFSSIEARMKIIEDAAIKNAGKGSGSQQLWVIILAVVSLLGTVAAIAARFF